MWTVKQQVKAGDPPEMVRPIVHELLSGRFNRYTVVYTDGSKSNGTVGAGVFGENISRSVGLPPQCSVFSAEAFAIKLALNLVENSKELLILSDSASCLAAIESGKSQHPWIQGIEDALHNRVVYLCWIPGHAGVAGNEEADRLADEGRHRTPMNVALPGKDTKKAMKQAIRQSWESQWSLLRDVKLREVKFTTEKWPDHANPIDQRVLTRLRIGHTRITHEFLLKRTCPPVCDCCGTTLDVRHLILECRKYDEARRQHCIDPTSLRVALSCDSENEEKLLKFLRDTNIYKYV